MKYDHLLHFPDPAPPNTPPNNGPVGETSSAWPVLYTPSFWHPYITAFFVLPKLFLTVVFFASVLGWVYIASTIYSCIALGDWAGLWEEAKRGARTVARFFRLAAVAVPLYMLAPHEAPFVFLGLASAVGGFCIFRGLRKELLGEQSVSSNLAPEASYLLVVVPAFALSLLHPLLGALALGCAAAYLLRNFQSTIQAATRALAGQVRQIPSGILALFQPGASGGGTAQQPPARLHYLLAFAPLGFVASTLTSASLSPTHMLAGAWAWVLSPVLTLAVFAPSFASSRPKPVLTSGRSRPHRTNSWDDFVRDLREGLPHA